jgi:MYXO-CTERM domain-containing protein
LGTISQAPPDGGAQFIGLIGPNVEDEHSATFAGGSVWAITFDVFVHSFNGSQTAGSFYLFGGGNYQLHAFPNMGAAGTWNAKFDVFSNTGAQINGADPGAGFDGLQMDHWYQEQIVFSTTSNQILSVSMDDPSNPGANATYDPTGWYFRGGASGPFSVAGLGVYAIGTLGFDNISLEETAPEPASWALCLLGAAALWRLRDGRRKGLPLS